MNKYAIAISMLASLGLASSLFGKQKMTLEERFQQRKVELIEQKQLEEAALEENQKQIKVIEAREQDAFQLREKMNTLETTIRDIRRIIAKKVAELRNYQQALRNTHDSLVRTLKV